MVEPALPIASQRGFQVWRYLVSHRQLLLRSNKGEDNDTRVEVLFKNVTAINLPTHLDGLTIEEPSDGDEQRLAIDFHPVLEPGQRIYRVRGLTYNGHIIAGAVFTAEDTGDYQDSSPLLRE